MNPALRNSEPFEELSARILCRGTPAQCIHLTLDRHREVNDDIHAIDMFLGEDVEHCTECGKVQCRQLLNDLFRQEVDTILVGLGFISIK